METTDKLTPQESRLTASEVALYWEQEAEVKYDPTGNGDIQKIVTETAPVNANLLSYFHYYYSVKLKLRPLSDISKEEAKELLGPIDSNSGITIKEIAVDRGGVYFKGAATCTHPNAWPIWSTYIRWDELTATRFTYLLSKGFCLFPEWFEQGKAIDKTKEVQHG